MHSNNPVPPATTAEPFIVERASSRLPTDFGDYQLRVFVDTRTQLEHIALTLGELSQHASPLVRVHSECLTGDIFSSNRCDCGEQLQLAQRLIQQAHAGLIIYLRGHEGRGIGLTNKIRAYALQEQGLDTVDANLALGLAVDQRNYDVAAAILQTLHLPAIRLLTNNPDKSKALIAHGIQISATLPLETVSNTANHAYLSTKRHRMGHRLNLLETALSI